LAQARWFGNEGNYLEEERDLNNTYRVRRGREKRSKAQKGEKG